mgnify:CR=1 FL=1
MVLVYNQLLVARSSGTVLFFKMQFDELAGRKKWKLFKEEMIRGFIYYVKGNVRI